MDKRYKIAVTSSDGLVVNQHFGHADQFFIYKEITEKMFGHYLNISWPVQDKVVLDDFYVGYTGGIRLIEDIYSVAVQRWN